MIKGLKKLHSAEPACTKRSDGDHLKFVIHKKADEGLPFDFAIELNGIKSWAVPDQPSMNPLEQRMAKEAKEIHKKILNFFEDESVSEELWDKGNYIPLDEDGNVLNEFEAHSKLRNGSLRFFLQGSKLVGEFILIKKAKKSWLLIKRHDEFALYHEFQIESLAG